MPTDPNTRGIKALEDLTRAVKDNTKAVETNNKLLRDAANPGLKQGRIPYFERHDADESSGTSGEDEAGHSDR